MSDLVTIEKNGVRIQVTEGLVLSHMQLGWWRVSASKLASETAPEPETAAEPTIEYVDEPEFLEKPRYVGKRRKK